MAEESPTPSSSSGGIDPKLASLLAYLLSIVGGIVFYLISKDKYVRFHAMQAILLGAAYIIVFVIFIIVPFLYWISWLAWLGYVVLSIVMMIKAYQGEKYKLPVIGDIAEKNS